MQRCHRSQTGFTLIELLVVIAIIAILAAILFPVFAQARDKARQATCLSNEKQIGTAAMMYVQDYDEYYPVRYGATPAPGARQMTWKDMLAPYLKNTGVYKCPSNPAARNVDANGFYPAGYSMYLPNGVAALVSGATYPPSVASIDRPSESLIIVETSWRWPDVGPWLGYAEPAPNDTNMTPGPSSWNSGHNKKKGNIIYMDGHAKWRALRDTFIENNGQNEWRVSKASADTAKQTFYFTLLNDLNKYPAND
jgi:prepilin-type N-terminal cleavage/methylation domain-containing protein/prepilin-type processing-associated H-X9-DG protein